MWRVTRQYNLSGDTGDATDQGSFDQQLSGPIGGPFTLPGSRRRRLHLPVLPAPPASAIRRKA
jgi:hypothetical protein